MSLAERSCAPVAPGTPPLTDDEIAPLAAEVPAWTRADKKLARQAEFEDFVEAMAFVNRLAEVAEDQGHHPDIHIHWNRVELEVWTHDIGGLSRNDFILAARIDRLLAAR